MKYNTLLEELEPPQITQLTDMPTKSLYGLLSTMSDSRSKRGRRYEIGLILTLIVLAKLAGESTFEGIAQWARLHANFIYAELKLKRRSLPCAATYALICALIDASAFTELLAQLLGKAGTLPQLKPKRASCHLALDGKTLKGTLGHTDPDSEKVHLLALYDVKANIVVRQEQIVEKQNEISASKGILSGLDLSGTLVSADAMHTQVKFCHEVHNAGGDYILIAKENQSALREDLRKLFEGEWFEEWERRTAQTVDKGHGRLEIRQISVTTAMNEYLAERWPHVAQVFRVYRRVKRGGEWTEEIVYGITSLPKEVASAKKLLDFIRDHWKIENRLHWRRDVTLGEDRSQIRKGNRPQVMAVFNNLVLSLFDKMGKGFVPGKMREIDANPLVGLRLILASP